MQKQAKNLQSSKDISIKIPLTKLVTLLVVLGFITLLVSHSQFTHLTHLRVWATREVPIAFWAWQTTNPSQKDVQKAISATKAKDLFIHAGQIDYVLANGRLRRIRQADGILPNSIALHLTYNATVDLLRNLEKVTPKQLADIITQCYQEDVRRVNETAATVVGIQLDIDFPTRLLPKYMELLGLLRSQLPINTKISITGLPTWINSPKLKETLAKVDFWIPQCYGTEIPKQLTRLSPISSLEQVNQAIETSRNLGYPFYAGLSAYGYAIRFNKNGNFVQIRGDIDPAEIITNTSLELVERQLFTAKSSNLSANEWCYLYKVREDLVIDGLNLKAGESIMLDLPTSEALRANIQAVRETAGEQLLGICIFRLPTEGNPTNLTIAEISDAIKDINSSIATEVNLLSMSKGKTTELQLTMKNTGSANPLMGDDSFNIDLEVPIGRITSLYLGNAVVAKPLCGALNGVTEKSQLTPCSLQRANVIRFAAKYLRPGEELKVVIEMLGEVPSRITSILSINLDNGRTWQEKRNLLVRKG